MKLTLETKRLILRPFSVDDAETMYLSWATDPEVTKFLTWEMHESVEETRELLVRWVEEYEKPERLNFAITLKASDELIGNISVVGYLGGVNGTPAIGYCISRKHWNNGYTTEACRELLSYLFSKGYSAVRIDAVKENIASQKVIGKCGGVYLGTDEELLEKSGKNVFINRYEVRMENFVK